MGYYDLPKKKRQRIVLKMENELKGQATETNAAQFELFEKMNNYLVNQLRPSPIPAYTVQNPYCCGYSSCSGCGC